MSDSSHNDQRRDRRIEVQLQVKLRFPDVERFRVFSTKDLSTGGIFVVSDTPKPVGSLVQVVMYPPGIELGLPLYGEVVWAISPAEAASAGRGPGMGIRFLELDEEAHGSLIDLVDTVMNAFEESRAPRPVEAPIADAFDTARTSGFGGSGQDDEVLLSIDEAPGTTPAQALVAAGFSSPASSAGSQSGVDTRTRPTVRPPPPPRSQPRAPIIPPPAAPSAGERRGTDRLMSRTPVRLRFADAKLFREFYTKDVSRGGVFVCTPQPLAEGSEVELILSLPQGEELRLEGRVARSIPLTEAPADSAGMGIEFTNLTLEKRAEINRQIEEMLSRRPPGTERLGRVRPVASAQVRYDSPLDFVRVVRGELRHRRLFVATDDPRPVGTHVLASLTAPQLPDGLQLSGEVDSTIERADAQRDGTRAGMYLRLTDLTDEALADLDLRVRSNANPIAVSKAAKLAVAAEDDLKDGKRASAIANLKLALSFDPSNREYKKFLDELVAEQNAQLAAKAKHKPH